MKDPNDGEQEQIAIALKEEHKDISLQEEANV